VLRCAKKAVLLSLVASSIGSAYPAKQSAALLSIGGAARVLDEISKKSQNAVPDAVLNSTKCVVVVPSISGGTVNVSASGVASCRDAADRWSAPAFVKFNGRGVRPHRTDLLVFVLSDTGVRALRSGELQIGGQKRAAAPLVSTTPVTTQLELDVESLTYGGAAGVLSSSEASGVIRGDAGTWDPIHNAVPRKTTEKYLSSVASFFNTITATGIVIHHTAVIPGESTAPRSERDIDEYHRARGFEILCFNRVYHVAYHYLIMPDGRVKPGRPERCEGAHAKGYNSYLGISVVGDFSSEDNPTGKKGPTRPTAKQIASLVQLCRRLKDRYNIPLQHIVRHSDISSTRCPGDRFPFRSVLDQLQRRSGDVTAGAWMTPPKRPMAWLTVAALSTTLVAAPKQTRHSSKASSEEPFRSFRMLDAKLTLLAHQQETLNAALYPVQGGLEAKLPTQSVGRRLPAI
jgi:N-acetylmuramoyl-L-alanine amidase